MSGHEIVMLAAICIGYEVLTPILDPAERPSETHGEPASDHILRLHIAFETNSATYIRCDYPHLSLFETHEFGEAVTDQVWDLGRSVNYELVLAGVPFGENRSCFHRHHGLPAHAVFFGNTDRGFCSHRSHVAVKRGL